VFVRVKVCDFVCPSTTLPYAKLDGVTDNPACTPVPLTEIFSGDPFASLITVMVPETLPPVVGAKTTFKIAVADGFSV
jgi:hypothetical protein